MTLKIKEKNYFDKTVFYTILYNEKIWITGVFFWIKDLDPDPIFSRIQIWVSQKVRIQLDPDPDPDPQHWFKPFRVKFIECNALNWWLESFIRAKNIILINSIFQLYSILGVPTYLFYVWWSKTKWSKKPHTTPTT